MSRPQGSSKVSRSVGVGVGVPGGTPEVNRSGVLRPVGGVCATGVRINREAPPPGDTRRTSGRLPWVFARAVARVPAWGVVSPLLAPGIRFQAARSGARGSGRGRRGRRSLSRGCAAPQHG